MNNLNKILRYLICQSTQKVNENQQIHFLKIIFTLNAIINKINFYIHIFNQKKLI